MSKTTYLDSVFVQTTSFSGIIEDGMKVSGLTAASPTTTVTAGTTGTCVWSSEAGWPNSGDWPAASAGDPFKGVLNITAIGADISIVTATTRICRNN